MAGGIAGLYSNVLGISSKIYIESRGLINPPRLAALALSTPNSSGIGGFLAAQGAGLLGGSAMRPGDMVFLSAAAGKPISLISFNQTIPGVKYFIREKPYPPSIANKLISGQQSVKGALIGAARGAAVAAGTAVASSLLTGGGFKGAVNNVKGMVKGALKKKPFGGATEGYGDRFNKTNYDGGAFFAAPIKTTTHYNNGQNPRTISRPKGNLIQLDGEWTSQWDIMNDGIISGKATANAETIVTNKGKSNFQMNLPYVLFQQYGDLKKYILLPGSISGLSETISPEWQNFRYVGSPFNTYRYGGVERSIKFNVKPSAFDKDSRSNLMENLDKLRKMAFPDENIAQIKFGGKGEVLYGFNPNLYYLTIHGYYKKMLGIVTDVSISVDDSTPWPTPGDHSKSDAVIWEPFPAVVDVSIGMKVIEDIPTKGTKIMYKEGKISKLTGKYIP